MFAVLAAALIVVASCSDCQDVIAECDQLRPLCIGTIVVAQIQDLQAVAEQLANSSTIPSLQESLPLIKSSNPLTQEQNDTLVQQLETALPVLTESLPLIRESLPLIRQVFDPIYSSDDVTTCQKKATCKSCRECPKLRQAITNFVAKLCPATCRTCGSAASLQNLAKNLAKHYV